LQQDKDNSNIDADDVPSVLEWIWDMDKFGFYKINNNKESKVKK